MRETKIFEDDIRGFFVENTSEYNTAKVMTKGFVCSDEPIFYKCIDQISKINLSNYFVNNIYQFLVIMKKDGNAEIITNESLLMEISIMPNRDISDGETVSKFDIVGIRGLRFRDIQIEKEDRIILCFKAGWKFGLYFDFRLIKEDEWTSERLSMMLGRHYRYMMFKEIYDLLDADDGHAKIFENNEWFPFIQILKEIEIQSDRLMIEEERMSVFKEIANGFDFARIQTLMNNWWRQPLFHQCKQEIEYGIDEYLKGNEEGYFKCLKILIPSIDGILHCLLHENNSERYINQSALIDTIYDEGMRKVLIEDDLSMPGRFRKYLSNIFYRSFKMGPEPISFSRNSVTHGVLPPVEHTKERALITILILDQIFFYITKGDYTPTTET